VCEDSRACSDPHEHKKDFFKLSCMHALPALQRRRQLQRRTALERLGRRRRGRRLHRSRRRAAARIRPASRRRRRHLLAAARMC
jgi:hypothetical protein